MQLCVSTSKAAIWLPAIITFQVTPNIVTEQEGKGREGKGREEKRREEKGKEEKGRLVVERSFGSFQDTSYHMLDCRVPRTCVFLFKTRVCLFKTRQTKIIGFSLSGMWESRIGITVYTNSVTVSFTLALLWKISFVIVSIDILFFISVTTT